MPSTRNADRDPRQTGGQPPPTKGEPLSTLDEQALSSLSPEERFDTGCARICSEYGLKFLRLSRVRGDLNGHSIDQFITAAQQVLEIVGRVCVDEMTLDRWRRLGDPKFTEARTADAEFLVDGHVEGSDKLSSAECVARGYCNLTKYELAAAHTAYWLLTKSDMFRGHLVRTSDGALVAYDKDGCRLTDASDFPDLEASQEGLFACKRLSSREI